MRMVVASGSDQRRHLKLEEWHSIDEGWDGASKLSFISLLFDLFYIFLLFFLVRVLKDIGGMEMLVG